MEPSTRATRIRLPFIRSLAEIPVLFAIGILTFGLLFPAILRVNEALDRSACLWKMRQWSVALHGYATDQSGRMPMGVVLMKPDGLPLDDLDYGRRELGLPHSPTTQQGYKFGPNWAVMVLPYMTTYSGYVEARVEEYEKDPHDRWRMDYTKDANRPPLRAVVLDSFQCPSDQTKHVPYGIDGYGNSTDAALVQPGDVHGWARGNYVGSTGPDLWEHAVGGKSTHKGGGFFGINYGGDLGKITNLDGSSNTLILTEVLKGVNEYDPRGVWALGFPGASLIGFNALSQEDAFAKPQRFAPTDGRVTFRPNDAGDGVDMFPSCSVAQRAGARDNLGCSDYLEYVNSPDSLPRYGRAQARSNHPGGVNVCFGDGVVKFVRNDLEPCIWRYMLSRDDGLVFG